MGTLVKRNKSWCCVFNDQKGKQIWKTAPKGSTKAEAKEMLRELEDKVRKGTFLPIKKIPTFPKVAEDWLNHKKANLRKTTWEVYEGHVRNHFEEFAGLLINQITTAGVEKFIDSRLIQGMKLGTLRKIRVTLGQILAYAAKHKYIDHNPIQDAEKLRGQGNEKGPKDKIKILSSEQIQALLEQVKDPKYHCLFLMAIMTGARQGELLGLKWSDIDWEKKQVRIRRTFTKGDFYDPKTTESRRRIDLAPSAVRELKKWKLACPVNELGLIFPNQEGNPINYSNMMQRHFLPGLKAAGLPKYRFHDLRHTYASIMLVQTKDIKYVQTQLGHSSPMVTLNIYAHLLKPTNQEAVCSFEETVFGKTISKSLAKSKKGSRLKTVTP